MPSSVIRTFDSEPSERRLDVVFTSGRAYSYHGVPLETFDAMKTSGAKGVFFNRRIRDHFPCTRTA